MWRYRIFKSTQRFSEPVGSSEDEAACLVCCSFQQGLAQHPSTFSY